MSLNPLPVFCRCAAPAAWLVETPGPRNQNGHRAAVCCDGCLRAIVKWAGGGPDPPQVVALRPDEMPTLF